MMTKQSMSSEEVLNHPAFKAISYGGYRMNSRRVQPTMAELREDMLILSAMGVKLIRTYNVHLPHAIHVLEVIDALQKEKQDFEMYVMLGAWIDCKNAWTGFEPIHHEESERNRIEIQRAVELANKYPHIVKVIAVGNEAMIRWATEYYVQPWIILKWVTHLQDLKKDGHLHADVWVTSSDNFASWGGGDAIYHTPELKALYQAVDYVSIHTYPMHDTHYHPIFWGVTADEMELPKEEAVHAAMKRALGYAISQYESVRCYMLGLGIDKPIHIGESGWSTHANERYGHTDSMAVDEYKAGLYYHMLREWSDEHHISCFYFEAFDEPWKDSGNPDGSENHFGLFTVSGKAKYALWEDVDKGTFDGLTRGGEPITKTYGGDRESLLKHVLLPPQKNHVVQM